MVVYFWFLVVGGALPVLSAGNNGSAKRQCTSESKAIRMTLDAVPMYHLATDITFPLLLMEIPVDGYHSFVYSVNTGKLASRKDEAPFLTGRN